MEEKRHLSDKFMLRLPDGMRDRIKKSAEVNGRSMNSEIISTLREKYPPDTPDPRNQRLYELMVKYKKDHSGFTDEDQAELDTLISTMGMTSS
jgi:hypothetical protein